MGLLERAEALSLRVALALPPRAQRMLAGPPLVHDGQALAVEAQLMLRLMALAPQPDPASVPIPQGRALLRRQMVAAGGRQPIGSVSEVRAGTRPGRLYVPASAAPVGPLLVFFHGGGWIYGDLDAYDPVCRFVAGRSGVRVLSVDYRLAPEHPFPAAYDDCVTAYRWVVDHAAELGADPAQLGVGGDSAGGCLAATTAIAAAEAGLPCRFQLLVYPGTDVQGDTASRRAFNEGLVLTQEFMDLAKASYLPRPEDVTDPRVSPLLAELPAGLAAAHVVTAGFDPLRDEGEAYARKLADAGVRVELQRVPDQVHGFFNLVGVGRSALSANRSIADAVAAGLGSH